MESNAIQVHANARSCANCRAVMIRLIESGKSVREVSRVFGLSPQTIYRWVRRSKAGGHASLENRSCRPHKAHHKYPLPTEDLRKTFFGVLHAPPAEYGFNRTTWRICDLLSAMERLGHPMNEPMASSLIRAGGYRWRQARRVLTSNDAKFREKVDRLKATLATLSDDEAFFSVDEFGPFAVRMRGGRALVPPGGLRSVPQWQRSKGALIVTAALELSANQVTHFYSRRKNTGEMVTLLQKLSAAYSDRRTLYITWDAAPWH